MKNRKFIEEEIIPLEAGYNAIIQKSLPCFTIPVTIDALLVGKALLNLGANINLMPLSMMKIIGTLEVQPTKMTLRLADRSIMMR